MYIISKILRPKRRSQIWRKRKCHQDNWCQPKTHGKKRHEITEENKTEPPGAMSILDA